MRGRFHQIRPFSLIFYRFPLFLAIILLRSFASRGSLITVSLRYPNLQTWVSRSLFFFVILIAFQRFWLSDKWVLMVAPDSQWCLNPVHQMDPGERWTWTGFRWLSRRPRMRTTEERCRLRTAQSHLFRWIFRYTEAEMEEGAREIWRQPWMKLRHRERATMMRMVQLGRNSDSLKNNLPSLKKASKNTTPSIL